MQKPLISIIIPVHNASKTLHDSISSIMAQTLGFKSLELVLVENGSHDNSKEIVQELEQAHSNIHALILGETVGPGEARNKGLELAQAKYVMFLDADDLYSPDACEKLFQTAENGNYDFVSGAYSRIDVSGNTILAIGPGYAGLPETHYELPAQMAAHLVCVRDAFWSKIYRRDIIQKKNIRFLPNGAAEDLYFLYSYLFACKNACYIPYIIYHYRIATEGESMAQSVSKQHFIKIAKNYQTIYQVFEENEENEGFRIISQGILDYHLCRMLRSIDITVSDAAEILKQWAWLFLWKRDNNAAFDIFAAAVQDEMITGQYEEAAKFLQRLRSAAEGITQLNMLIEKNAYTINELVEHNDCLVQENNQLQAAILIKEEQYSQNKEATASLNAIKNSRSWRLITKLQKIKNYISTR